MKMIVGAKTHFSVGESIYSPSQIIKDAKEAGYESIAVADTMSLHALPQLSKAAKEHDIKLIIGVALNMVDDINWRKAKRGEKKTKNGFCRPILYIKNDQGLKDVMALLTLANSDDRFYIQANLSLQDVLNCIKLGNVVPSTGNVHSVFSHKNSTHIANSMKDAQTEGQLVTELCLADTAYYDRITLNAVQYSEHHSSIPVLSSPVFHPEGQDSLRNTMDCIINRNKIHERWANVPACDLSLPPYDKRTASLKAQSDRIDWTNEEAEVIRHLNRTSRIFGLLCDFTWHDMEISLPDMSASGSDDSFELLRKACIAGFKSRLSNYVFGYKPSKDDLMQYKHRLGHELVILKQMGFEDYFLLVRQVTDWCKDSDIIVGPGRGSVGGSLVAFLLGITDVDPIRFGLIFERFINPERMDLPDIDLDFMSSRRAEVVEMLEHEFGSDCVAGIANYGELGAASALRQVASAHDLREYDFRCSKLIGTGVTLEEAQQTIPEVETFSLIRPLVWKQACGLQGTFRNFGRHAAGVVVAGEPLTERAVIEKRHDHSVIHYDKRTCEAAGLVKLDILGLSNLDLLNQASVYIKELHGKKMDWSSLELNDQYVLEAFAKGDTAGVFQFESGSARKLLKQMAEGEPLTFQCLADATALNRPGPIESGMMEQYVDIRQGCASASYAHPVMESALKATHSVFIYQEQIMQVAKDLCGFSAAQADFLRKAMGKKSATEMEKQKEAFVKGAMATSGMAELTAEHLFGQIEKFAGYGFNKSHSVAYSLISFITMYIKVHIPHVFYASALTALGDDKTLTLVRDAEKHGIKVLPPDINKSSDRYEISSDENDVYVLYAPLQAIKGLSEKGCRAIMEAKRKKGTPFSTVDEFIATVDRRSCNIRVRETMDKVGTFASIQPFAHPSIDESRLKDQKDLLPNIMLSSVKANRAIDLSHRNQFRKIITDIDNCNKCTLATCKHVKPRIGKTPKIMLVRDSPSKSEADKHKFSIKDYKGETTPLGIALEKAGLSFADVYITSLVRAAKPDKGFEMEQINRCSDYLKQEIELMNPPVIITMGSESRRYLMPDLKGRWDELVGMEHYDSTTDSTVIVGFNPGMIYFDRSRQSTLNDLFENVSLMLQGTPS